MFVIFFCKNRVAWGYTPNALSNFFGGFPDVESFCRFWWENEYFDSCKPIKPTSDSQEQASHDGRFTFWMEKKWSGAKFRKSLFFRISKKSRLCKWILWKSCFPKNVRVLDPGSSHKVNFSKEEPLSSRVSDGGPEICF